MDDKDEWCKLLYWCWLTGDTDARYRLAYVSKTNDKPWYARCSNAPVSQTLKRYRPHAINRLLFTLISRLLSPILHLIDIWHVITNSCDIIKLYIIFINGVWHHLVLLESSIVEEGGRFLNWHVWAVSECLLLRFTLPRTWKPDPSCWLSTCHTLQQISHEWRIMICGSNMYSSIVNHGLQRQSCTLSGYFNSKMGSWLLNRHHLQRMMNSNLFF